MKINRENGPPIIIGKRITVGGLAGALIGVLVYLVEIVFELKIPAQVAVHLTTLAIVAIQIWIVNKFGVTEP